MNRLKRRTQRVNHDQELIDSVLSQNGRISRFQGSNFEEINQIKEQELDKMFMPYLIHPDNLENLVKFKEQLHDYFLASGPDSIDNGDIVRYFNFSNSEKITLSPCHRYLSHRNGYHILKIISDNKIFKIKDASPIFVKFSEEDLLKISMIMIAEQDDNED